MADEYFSDDSELYGTFTFRFTLGQRLISHAGDKKYTALLESRAVHTDVHGYWKTHAKDLNVVARKAREELEASKPKPLEGPKIPKGGLHNSYEGEESAWQLHETVDDFLTRVPLLSSSHVGPWLWVANPYSERDSLPEGKDAVFSQLGPRLLQEYSEKKRKIAEENPNAPPASITRKLYPDREKLKSDILELAKKNRMTCGKWMLFPSEENAPGIWKQIVTATLESQLGIAAKIASDGDPRLICVYTKDFSDEADVKRVVQQLKDMNLLPDESSNRGIYYKCDAYTYLDIKSDNPYGLKASLYASKDVLAEKEGKGKAPATTQKRATDFFAPQNSAKRRK